MSVHTNSSQVLIPSTWIGVKLGEIEIWGSGGTPSSTVQQYYDGDIPWLVIGDLNDGYIYKSKKRISEAGLENSSAKIVAPGNVLVAMYGSIGKVGINKIPVATNQAIAFTQELRTCLRRIRLVPSGRKMSTIKESGVRGYSSCQG